MSHRRERPSSVRYGVEEAGLRFSAGATTVRRGLGPRACPTSSVFWLAFSLGVAVTASGQNTPTIGGRSPAEWAATLTSDDPKVGSAASLCHLPARRG